MSDLPRIVIVENGGQLTLNIQRILREEGYRSAVLDPKKAEAFIAKNPVDAVILSGGAASVYEKGAPTVPQNVFSCGAAVMGICYGMQAIAHHLGGTVERSGGQYAAAGRIRLQGDSLLWRDMPQKQAVTLSHGDSVVTPPAGFEVAATREDGTGIMAIADDRRRIYAVQFHPEAVDSEHGRRLLLNFLAIARCGKNWKPQSLAQSIEDRMVREVGDDIAAVGFSGGVDSTTVARIGRVLGDRLIAITLDAGNLREGELEEIRLHARLAGVRHEIIDIRNRFEYAFMHTADSEVERKIFQRLYAAALKERALAHGAKFIFQGTLAPDLIESAATGAAKIKTHHNVGIDWSPLTILEPVSELFKYEVRDLARGLELAESVWKRHPFPGPGLFLRVVGTPILFPRVEVVRQADSIATRIVKRHGIYDELSQMPTAVFFGDRVTGVRGDGRAYEHMAVVRPVTTSDFMTLKGRHLPDEVEDEINFEMSKHPQLLGALFDYNPKPPHTTEFK